MVAVQWASGAVTLAVAGNVAAAEVRWWLVGWCWLHDSFYRAPHTRYPQSIQSLLIVACSTCNLSQFFSFLFSCLHQCPTVLSIDDVYHQLKEQLPFSNPSPSCKTGGGSNLTWGKRGWAFSPCVWGDCACKGECVHDDGGAMFALEPGRECKEEDEEVRAKLRVCVCVCWHIWHNRRGRVMFCGLCICRKKSMVCIRVIFRFWKFSIIRGRGQMLLTW